MLEFFVNTAKWAELPKHYQSLVLTAAGLANVHMQAKYDAVNPAALKRLASSGAILKPFPNEVMEACFNSANQLYDETMAKNGDFKKVYEALKAYRADQYLWFQISEYTFDTFMMIQQRKKTL